MKTITFQLKDAAHYSLIYEALLASEGIKATEARLFNRIMQKFEMIGHSIEEVPFFKLTSNNKVDLEDVEYSLMRRLLDSVTFTSTGARKAAQTFEWLEHKETNGTADNS